MLTLAQQHRLSFYQKVFGKNIQSYSILGYISDFNTLRTQPKGQKYDMVFYPDIFKNNYEMFKTIKYLNNFQDYFNLFDSGNIVNCWFNMTSASIEYFWDNKYTVIQPSSLTSTNPGLNVEFFLSDVETFDIDGIELVLTPTMTRGYMNIYLRDTRENIKGKYKFPLYTTSGTVKSNTTTSYELTMYDSEIETNDILVLYDTDFNEIGIAEVLDKTGDTITLQNIEITLTSDLSINSMDILFIRLFKPLESNQKRVFDKFLENGILSLWKNDTNMYI